MTTGLLRLRNGRTAPLDLFTETGRSGTLVRMEGGVVLVVKSRFFAISAGAQISQCRHFPSPTQGAGVLEPDLLVHKQS